MQSMKDSSPPLFWDRARFTRGPYDIVAGLHPRVLLPWRRTSLLLGWQCKEIDVCKGPWWSPLPSWVQKPLAATLLPSKCSVELGHLQGFRSQETKRGSGAETHCHHSTPNCEPLTAPRGGRRGNQGAEPDFLPLSKLSLLSNPVHVH